MLNRLKQYLLILIGIGIFFFILSHHFIFSGWNEIDLLKKEKLTLAYTFFSLKQADPTKVLRIEPLRDAGIADIMVERKLVTPEQLDKILLRIDTE